MFVSQNVSNVGWMDDFRATKAPSENGELACDRGNPIMESPTKCLEFRSRNDSNLLRVESQIHHFWANYNDLSRGHLKWWFSKGIPQNPLNSCLGTLPRSLHHIPA